MSDKSPSTYILPDVGRMSRLSFVDIAPLAEPRSRTAYLLLFGMALSAVLLATATNFTISPRFPLKDVLIWVAVAIVIAMMFRRAGWLRISDGIETITVTVFMGFMTSLALIPMAALSGPFADAELARLDHGLGLDWLAFYASVSAHPWLMIILKRAYDSFFVDSAAIFALLCATRQHERAWQLGAANAWSLWFAFLLFPFAPAVGAVVHYGIPHSALLGPGSSSALVLHAIKGGERVISGSLMGGLISFPSYHAAVAVLLTWGGWKTLLRWPVAILNATMFVASAIFGGHYFVDLIAGGLVAAAAIVIASRRPIF